MNGTSKDPLSLGPRLHCSREAAHPRIRAAGVARLPRWSVIRHKSYVLVAVSEGREGVDGDTQRVVGTSDSPKRFIGKALMTVHSIAPFDGGVDFVVTVEWGSPLTVR
jgi:hypothetical protein